MTAPTVELVVMGMSWGGLHALSTVLRRLPATFAIPIAVVQHRSKEATSMLRELLQDCTRLRVREVEDKDPLEPGWVYLAPPDYHLLVEPGHFALSVDAPVRFSRPSIDVTFSSASDAYGPRLAGVVLTGANDDGARGLRCIADRGGVAIVQDPATAESPIMPLAALRLVPEAEVHPLDGLAARLQALGGADGAARAARGSHAAARSAAG
jgi:two-component system chemotaxis response regulator CheB